VAPVQRECPAPQSVCLVHWMLRQRDARATIGAALPHTHLQGDTSLIDTRRRVLPQ